MRYPEGCSRQCAEGVTDREEEREGERREGGEREQQEARACNTLRRERPRAEGWRKFITDRWEEKDWEEGEEVRTDT